MLLDYVADWAAGQNIASDDADHFRGVPWNAPYYPSGSASASWPEAEVTPGLAARKADSAGTPRPACACSANWRRATAGGNPTLPWPGGPVLPSRDVSVGTAIAE